jgi:predicted site-specific integrase-resolvase
VSNLLTPREVARILRVDETTVRRWIRQGTLEAVVLPHSNDSRQAHAIKQETLNKLLGEQEKIAKERGSTG